MRHWHYTALVGAVAALAVAALFALDLFAGKPKDGNRDDNYVAEKGSAKGSDVVLTSRSESAAKLPITKVVLFNSGVGYFERQGEVEGDARVDLAFNVQDVNDILKSMVVQDMNGGKVSAISFDSLEPLDKTLRSFSIDLSKNPSFAQILDQARGERVEVVLQQSNTTHPAPSTAPSSASNCKSNRWGKKARSMSRCSICGAAKAFAASGFPMFSGYASSIP